MAVRIEQARAEDLPDVLALLIEQRLPTDGLAEHVTSMLVAREAARLVGSAALEISGDGALMRSVVVAVDLRGQGLGGKLTEAALELAKEHQVPAVYLLTTTAEQYFPKFGFEHITRADVPASVQRSAEFRFACPSSAIVMRKRLEPRRT